LPGSFGLGRLGRNLLLGFFSLFWCTVASLLQALV
jgi:hypothetical protein